MPQLYWIIPLEGGHISNELPGGPPGHISNRPPGSYPGGHPGNRPPVTAAIGVQSIRAGAAAASIMSAAARLFPRCMSAAGRF